MPENTIPPFLFHSSMSSIKALEQTCNVNEINLNGKLKSLDIVVNPSGAKFTEAIFEDQDDDDGLGNLTIKKFNATDEAKATFKGKAFILTQPVDVLVFRS